MPRAAWVGWFALACLSGCATSRATHELRRQPPPAHLTSLPDGATLVWLGDSLTWQLGYSDRVEHHFASHHARKRFRFVNLARRGDTVGDVLARFEREVVPLAPDALLVMLGMNDAGHLGLRPDLLRTYLERMGNLEARVRRLTRARLVLVTPTCVLPDAYSREQKNRMLSAMAEGLEALARSRGVAIARVHTPFCHALRGDDGPGLMSDPEHPSDLGHALLAEILLAVIDPEGY